MSLRACVVESSDAHRVVLVSSAVYTPRLFAILNCEDQNTQQSPNSYNTHPIPYLVPNKHITQATTREVPAEPRLSPQESAEHLLNHPHHQKLESRSATPATTPSINMCRTQDHCKTCRQPMGVRYRTTCQYLATDPERSRNCKNVVHAIEFGMPCDRCTHRRVKKKKNYKKNPQPSQEKK
jgi:hypothetical protein